MKKNILEGLLKYFLDRHLSLKFDICTCEKCKEAMLSYLVDKFVPVYAEDDSPSYQELEKGLIKKYSKEIFGAINEAIEKISKNPPHPSKYDREKEFNNLLDKIKEDRGVDFSLYHRGILKRRIALRVSATKSKSYSEYLHVLASDPKEYEKLFEVLTINVSEFFRDYSVWISIEKLLRGLIASHKDKGVSLNLWSAGCAKGEEAYSLAIIMKEINKEGIPFRIYATDIDLDCLKEAEEGVYDYIRTKNVKKEFLEKYFVIKGDKYYIKPIIKDVVEFRYLDLISSPYLENMDMITCRNVFIYFTKALQERIVDKFYHSLKEGGYLVIGKSETLVYEARVVFKEIDMYNRIYQKIAIK